MRGIARLPRWESAAAFTVIVAVFFTAWWAARPKDDTIRVIYPDRPDVGPDAARWELVGVRLDEVRLGMARADVEAVLGPPEPMNVDAMVKDQTTYRTRYRAVLKKPLPFAPDVSGFCEADLTFDASKPGHPLLRITCTPRTPPPSRQTVSMAV